MAFAGKRVLILVENLPSPFDRRVWQEATTLRAHGYEVSIICPTGKGYEKRHEELEGIHIYRYRLPLEAEGAKGYAIEYSLAAVDCHRRIIRSASSVRKIKSPIARASTELIRLAKGDNQLLIRSVAAVIGSGLISGCGTVDYV